MDSKEDSTRYEFSTLSYVYREGISNVFAYIEIAFCVESTITILPGYYLIIDVTIIELIAVCFLLFRVGFFLFGGGGGIVARAFRNCLDTINVYASIMFKESATNLHDIPVDKGIEWLNSFDTILTDCDGEFDLSNLSKIHPIIDNDIYFY